MSMKPEQRCRKPLSTKCSGTSLVEVMIALTIFGSLIAITCKVLLSTNETLDMARDHYTAANLAKNRLELVRSFEFDQIPELEEEAIIINESGIASEYGHYQRTTSITMLSSNLYEIGISVGIQNRRTLEFSPAEQSINTYVSKHL